MILLGILIIGFIGCNKPHTDQTKTKAIYSFALNCRGMTVNACYDTCNTICGIDSSAAVTPSSLPCISSCQSSCKTSCDVTSLLLIYINYK